MKENFYDLVDKFIIIYIDMQKETFEYIDTTYSKKKVLEKSKKLAVDYLRPYVIDIIMFKLNAENQTVNLDGKKRNTKILTFFNKITPEFIQITLSEFKGLKELLDLRLDLLYKYINEIFLNLEEFKKEYKFLELNNLTLSAGDSHSGGKSVANICIDNTHLIYKPRASQLDENFIKFVRKYIKDYGFKVYNYEQFSIHEFVQNIQPTSEEDRRDYYYNIGFISAIFYFLNASDMHYENLIISNSFPYFIDLETLVNVPIQDKNITQIGHFMDMLSNSVLETLIYPTRVNTIELDVSALTGGGREVGEFFYKNKSIVDYQDDSVRYEEVDIFLENKQNQIYKNGKRLHPITYLEFIKKGFRAFCNEILLNKHKMGSSLIDIIKESYLRQVLRPTHVYEKFLLTSYEPYYMQSQQNREVLFQILHNGEDIYNLKTQLEVIDLLKGDVPIFYSYYSDTHLYNKNKKVLIHNYFGHSPMSKILEKVSNFNEKEMEMQVNLIETSLLVSAFNLKQEIARSESKTIIDYSKNNNYGVAVLNEFFHLLDKRENSIMGIFPIYSGEELMISGVNTSLYEYGGTIILMSYYMKELGINIEFFINLILTIKKSKFHAPERLDAFNGLGAYLYTNYFLYKNTNHIFFLNEINHELKGLNSNFAADTEIDFLTGLSGMNTVLVNISNDSIVDLHGKEKVKYFIHESTSYIIDNLHTIETKPGMAHGLSGTILGLATSNLILNNDELKLHVERLLNLEESYFNDQENNYIDPRTNEISGNYYCYGLPGILLCRLQLYRLGYLSLEVDIKMKLDKLVASVLNLNEYQNQDSYCLCHGTGSIIEVMEEAFRLGVLKESRYNEIMNKLLPIMIDNDNNGLFNSIKSYGLMLGETGKSYLSFRNTNKKIPSFLLLNIE